MTGRDYQSVLMMVAVIPALTMGWSRVPHTFQIRHALIQRKLELLIQLHPRLLYPYGYVLLIMTIT